MIKRLLLPFLMMTYLSAVEIIDKPILFGEKRIALTKSYINEHYERYPKDISISPRIILVHYTGIDDFQDSYSRFIEETLPTDKINSLARRGAMMVEPAQPTPA